MDSELDAISRGEKNATAEGSTKLRYRGHWAEYLVCPVCRTILSGKKKKLVEMPDGTFLHKTCLEIMRKRIQAMAGRGDGK